MGAGKGNQRRAQSAYTRDVFENVEGWCLRHPDAMKQAALARLLGRSHGLEALKKNVLTLENGAMSRHTVNREIAKRLAEYGPAQAEWTELFEMSDDPRVLAAHAIMAARAHLTDFAPVMDTCLDRVESEPLQEAMALTYGILGNTQMIPRLNELAESSNEFVSQAAEWALQQMPTEEQARELLVDDFHDFVGEITAEDFARFQHYAEGDGDGESDDYAV